MIHWIRGWFRDSPPPRTDEQLADLIEATPPGGLITLHADEDIFLARWIVRSRQARRDRECRRRMRGGIDWPGAE